MAVETSEVEDNEKELASIDWGCLRQGTAEDALNQFHEILWMILIKNIPRRAIKCKKSSHPWLNARCRMAIQRKNEAEKTDTFVQENQKCTEILHQERAKYVESLKKKLASLPRSNKQWWRINRELLNRKCKLSSVPPLRDDDAWISDAKAKADSFAKCFASKNVLPPEEVDTPFFGNAEIDLTEFIALRSRTTKKLFGKLKEDTATGNDKISATILKKIKEEISAPFTFICRRLLYEGCWPLKWKLHLVIPIYKKGSAYKASNYRGVHLTTILSKVAERLIGHRLVEFLQKNAFGNNQWAFSKGLGSKDLVVMLLMSWILTICSGKKVAAYLSDISGAFDKVYKPYLLAKLNAAGIGPIFLNFLDAYLASRKSKIDIHGEVSKMIAIENSVYRGKYGGLRSGISFLLMTRRL